MKTTIFQAIRLTILTLLFFSGIYTLIILGIAQLAQSKGNGETITVNGKKYYTNVGQSFTEDNYFNSRPSAVNYHADGSGGSNKGPSNPEYLAQVQARIDTFLTHNPSVKVIDIPADLVTASGSGLDPHISIQGAYVQVQRIAKARNISPEKLNELVQKNIEQPLFGLFGTSKVNVLKLNIALDNLK